MHFPSQEECSFSQSKVPYDVAGCASAGRCCFGQSKLIIIIERIMTSWTLKPKKKTMLPRTMLLKNLPNTMMPRTRVWRYHNFGTETSYVFLIPISMLLSLFGFQCSSGPKDNYSWNWLQNIPFPKLHLPFLTTRRTSAGNLLSKNIEQFSRCFKIVPG